MVSIPEDCSTSKNGDRSSSIGLRRRAGWMRRAGRWSAVTAFGVPMVACALSYAVLQPEKTPKEYIKVEIRGLLRHGVMAIGGETTGTEIEATGISFELDVSAKQALQEASAKLDGKTAVVTGYLTRKKSVERGLRWVVVVDAIREGTDS